MFNLEILFKALIVADGSDIHLKVGAKPMLRINGALKEWGDKAISASDMKQIVDILLQDLDRSSFEKNKEIDFAFGVTDLGRFRVNIFQQRNTYAVAIRAIPFNIKTFHELGLPSILEKVCLRKRGLILVTGTVGSGKSTTLAAMINHINSTRRANIITIEDPIEFLFRDKKSIIHQREVGHDTASYEGSLRYLLRQDPDVIMIGEIRDAESMMTALKAANTGHLVMSTLHTTDAMQTISRILSFFPSDQKDEVRGLLASTLLAFTSQRLIPRADGKGRVVATEVLTASDYVKECVEDSTKTHEIMTAMTKGKIYGMHSFDQSILALYKRGLVSLEEAKANATSPSDFEMKAKGLSSDGDNLYFGDNEDY